MEPRGKTVLITGGARIGRAVAEWLAVRGANVALTYHRSSKSAQETIRKVEGLGVRGIAIRTDLTREVDVRKVVRGVTRRFGRLDILINMASVYEKTPFPRLDSRVWQVNMEANLRSAYLLAVYSAPFMKQKGGGRIINFSDWVSASGRPRYKDYVPYYVSKAGVIGLTEALALELAPRILVNTIAPGPILSPKGLSAKEDRAVRKATPLARWGGPDEIAKAVLFLIETDFVTGECIRVDGGRHLL